MFGMRLAVDCGCCSERFFKKVGKTVVKIIRLRRYLNAFR